MSFYCFRDHKTRNWTASGPYTKLHKSDFISNRILDKLRYKKSNGATCAGNRPITNQHKMYEV